MKWTKADKILAASLEADGLTDQLDDVGGGQDERFAVAAVWSVQSRPAANSPRARTERAPNSAFKPQIRTCWRVNSSADKT